MTDPKSNGIVAKFFAWVWGRLSGVVSFLLWIVTGFGLLGQFGKKDYKDDEVILYQVTKAFFLWLPMIVSFVSAAVVHYHHQSQITCAWIFIIANLYVMLCILFNIDFLRLIIVTLVIGFTWLLSSFLKNHNILLFSHIVNYITGLNPKLDTGFAMVWGWAMCILWITALIHAFGYGRIIISPNGIEEWHFGLGSEITDRMGLKFGCRYYDLLEFGLGAGAGTLEARRNDQSIVKQYHNVLFLFFWWPRLDEILHQRATIIDNTQKDPVDVEDVHHGHSAPNPASHVAAVATTKS